MGDHEDGQHQSRVAASRTDQQARSLPVSVGAAQVRGTRLRPVLGELRQGHEPPVDRPRGDRGRLRRGHASDGLDLRHLSRSRPHPGAGRADDAGLRRTDGPHQRPDGRKGRFDAPDQRGARRHGQLRDHRRPHADRLRRRVERAVPQDRPGRGLLLRRRLREHRGLSRSPELRGDLEAARSCSCARTTCGWSTPERAR